MAKRRNAKKKKQQRTRVRLRQAVERFPFFIAREGRTGYIVEMNSDLISVRMDEPIPGCEEWNNEILFSLPEDQAEFDEAVEVIYG